MTAIMLIAAALFGGLFWAGRRRRYYSVPVYDPARMQAH